MTPRERTRDFLLSDRPLEDVLSAGRERFELAGGGREHGERLVLDTADRKLRSKGCELSLEAEDGSAGELVLRESARPVLRARAEVSARYLAADLPAGALAERVTPLIDIRVLLPVVRVRTEERRWRLLDGEGKTVARMAHISGRVVADGRRRDKLTPRLQLRPVLGYDDAAEALAALLSGDLGLVEAGESVTDEAVRRTGGDPRGIVTKVRLDFAAEERADRATLAILDALADVVEANLPGTLEDLDPEFLHDLRVAVRRSRSVLRQMKGVLPPEGRDRARADLKWLQQATGDVRDLDVQLLGWDGLVADLPDELRADVAGVPSILARRRATRFSAMRRTLRGQRFRRSWSTYRKFLEEEPREPSDERPNADRRIGEVVGRRIRREYRRMVEMGEAIDDESPGEALHDLRKRGKELRYQLELFGHLWPADAVAPLVAVLKALQDVLGRHQDQEVQAGSLRAVADDLVASGEPGTTALALGVVVERLHREQAAARAQFAEAFAPFAAAEQRKLVRRTFRGPA